MMPSPGCGCCCIVFSDKFQRDAEDINGTDSTGNWDCSPGDVWEIFDTGTSLGSWLQCSAGTETGPFAAIWTGAPPRHFSCKANVSALGVSAPGDNNFDDTPKFRIVYEANSSDPLLTRRYAAEIEFIAGDSNADTDECGVMSLIDMTDLLSPVVLAGPTPVGQLVHRLAFSLKLCYDPETQMLVASITGGNSTNGVINSLQSIHARGADTDPDELDSSSIYLEWVLDEYAVGRINSFSVSQTKNLDNDETDPYGIADEEDPDCPCCRPSRCSVDGDDFEDGEIDCRWYQLLGTWTEADGKISTSSTGRLTWLGSWSGVNDDCQPDCTVKAWVTVKAPEEAYGIGKWRIELGGGDAGVVFAELSLVTDGDGELSEGTLTLKYYESGSPALLSTEDVEFEAGAMITLSVCYMYGLFTAIAGSFTTEYSGSLSEDGYSYDETTDFCATTVELVAPQAGVGAEFYSFGVSHNLDSPECEDCEQSFVCEVAECTGEDAEDLRNCIGGITPEHLKVRFDGAIGLDSPCLPMCEQWMGGTMIIGNATCFRSSTLAMGCADDCDEYNYYTDQCYALWNDFVLLTGDAGLIDCDDATSDVYIYMSVLLVKDGSEYRLIACIILSSDLGDERIGYESESLGESPLNCLIDFNNITLFQVCRTATGSRMCGVNGLNLIVGNL